MEIEYTEIDEMFAELGGSFRSWWEELEDAEWMALQADIEASMNAQHFAG